MIAAASADLNVISGSLLSRASSRRAAQDRQDGRSAPMTGSARRRSRSPPSPMVVMPAMVMVMVVPAVVVMVPMRPMVVMPARPVMMVPMAAVMMVVPMLHRLDQIPGLRDRRLSRGGSSLCGTCEAESDRDGQDHLTERHERLLMVCDTAN